MSDIKLILDTSGLEDMLNSFKTDVIKEVNEAVSGLAWATKEKIIEMASNGDNKLKSTLHIYKEALSDPKKESAGVYIITLDHKAAWIEEGIEKNHDMKPDLLKGRKTRVIPFRHDTVPSKSTPKAQDLVKQVRAALKEANIPFRGIERDDNGMPKIGRLHRLDIDSKRPTAAASFPALKGVEIHQKINEKGKVERGIFTFRTVSNGPASAGKWIHPGLNAKDYFTKARDWAEQEWNDNILPELLKKWGG